MPTNREIRDQINQNIQNAVERFYEEIPYAKDLRGGDSINRDYFIRHTIETILRIRLARAADGIAISKLALTRPRVAKTWAKYTEEELLHDKMFAKDLESLGVTQEEIYSTEPFVATKLLQGYLYYTLEHEGPIGLLGKSYFLEYSTGLTQHIWNANIARSLGERAVAGANAHADYDEDIDHSDDVWRSLEKLLETDEDRAALLRHIDTYILLFRMYFSELYRGSVN